MYGDLDTLVYVILFIGVLLFVEGLYYLLHDARKSDSRTINKRLRLIKQTGDARAALRKYRLDQGTKARGLAGRATERLFRMQLQAGSSASPRRVMGVVAGLTLVSTVASEILLTLPDAIDFLIGLTVGVGLPILVLLRRQKKRLARFGRQLPDAIDLVVRALRAGHPTSASLALVAKEMPDPIGTEFGLVVDEMTYGLDMDEALEHMAMRVPHPDISFLVAAIQIQHFSGGNLAEILANLSTVIRERFHMFAKARAVSAEGRFSAWVVGLLPGIVAVVIHVIDRKYFTEVQHDPVFLPMMALAVLLVIGGGAVIWRMVNFKI